MKRIMLVACLLLVVSLFGQSVGELDTFEARLSGSFVEEDSALGVTHVVIDPELERMIRTIYNCVTKTRYIPDRMMVSHTTVNIGGIHGPLTEETRVVKSKECCWICFKPVRVGDMVKFVEFHPDLCSCTRMVYMVHVSCAEEREAQVTETNEPETDPTACPDCGQPTHIVSTLVANRANQSWRECNACDWKGEKR